MIETISFLLGLGFSLLVYFRSIKPANLPFIRKTAAVLFTFIGITGMIFLFGLVLGEALR